MSEKSKGRPQSEETRQKLRGFAVVAVAEAAKVSKATVHNWISGKNGGAPMAGMRIELAIERLSENKNTTDEEIERQLQQADA